MKPLNLDNRPCSPVSSNCVVWQGPDIPCINLCKGDTVSDVVAALATELCTILDQLNVSNYDLSCLGITACGPKDFQALIQLLIDKICDTEGITDPDIRIEPGCPDCVVTVAECFRTGNNTTMQLLDYVNMIAEKVCALIDEIANINQQIDEIIIRIENLENAPVPVTPIPSFTLGCTIGSLGTGTTQFINVILQEFINNVWCPLQNTLGSNSDLISAVSAICIQDTDLQLSTGTPFSTNPNWIQSGSYDTVADAINNLWVALCDVYKAFQTYSPPISIVTAGSGVTVTSSTVGTSTTYQVSAVAAAEKPGLSVSLSPPANLFKTAPALNSPGRLCDGSIQIMNSIEYNDFGPAYDPTTGVFTVPSDGVYSFGFFTSFTRETGTGWHDPLVPGMFIAGITSRDGCNFLCVNNNSPVVIQKHSSINGSITRRLTAGTQICLKVINLTNFDYLTVSGDVARFFVQRVN